MDTLIDCRLTTVTLRPGGIITRRDGMSWLLSSSLCNPILVPFFYYLHLPASNWFELVWQSGAAEYLLFHQNWATCLKVCLKSMTCMLRSPQYYQRISNNSDTNMVHFNFFTIKASLVGASQLHLLTDSSNRPIYSVMFCWVTLGHLTYTTHPNTTMDQAHPLSTPRLQWSPLPSKAVHCDTPQKLMRNRLRNRINSPKR